MAEVNHQKIHEFVNEMRNPDELATLIWHAIEAGRIYYGVDLR